MIKLLNQPFERIQSKNLLAIGLCSTAVTALLLHYLQQRFTGLLMLSPFAGATYLQISLDLMVTSLLPMVLLFALGKLINAKTRWIDIVNTVLIARLPMYLMLLLDLGGYQSQIVEKMMSQGMAQQAALNLSATELTFLMCYSFIALLTLIGFAFYIYRGFKTATHLKKPGHLILMILAVLLADLISRFITPLY